MNCQGCHEKEAKVTIKRLVEGKLILEDLCLECARVLEKPEHMTLFSEEGLLHHMMDVMEDSVIKIEHVLTLRCPNCGLTYLGYKKIRKLGCAICYSTFSEKLEDWIKRYHGSTCHIGIRPDGGTEDNMPLTQSLFHALRAAVEKEDFETAAMLRDRIKRIMGANHGE